jgi:hypothetical protein
VSEFVELCLLVNQTLTVTSSPTYLRQLTNNLQTSGHFGHGVRVASGLALYTGFSIYFNNINLKFVSVRYQSTHFCAGAVSREWLQAAQPSGTEMQSESGREVRQEWLSLSAM